MKTQSYQGAITSSGFEGFEEQDYTIKSSGKAFRVLLNTIYTNKERAAARELMTNAFDAQVAAGTSNKPFIVHLPNITAPTFRVRDFGESMTHEQVMKLYTTVFESSKEDTNAQVGQLGLGSKAPFAYTDAFTVIAWKDGEKRTYLANVGVDDKPTIRHLGTEPSNEPQGIEVSFPVKQDHFQVFATEVASLVLGFDRLPIIEGNQITVKTPLFGDGNWRVFEGTPNSIRQGCVIYPITEHQLRLGTSLKHGYGLIVDVPIGTVDIAANREALSLDDETRKRVIAEFEKASKAFSQYVADEIAAAPTRLEAEIAWHKWRTSVYDQYSGNMRHMTWQGQQLTGYIEFCPDPKNPPPLLPKMQDYKEKEIQPKDMKFSVGDLEKLDFILDQNTRSIPRRRLRIRQHRKETYGRYATPMYILCDATPAQVAWVKQMLGAKDDQFTEVEDLPDVPQTPSGAKVNLTGQSRSGVYEATAATGWMPKRLDTDAPIAADFIWLPIEKFNEYGQAYVTGLGSVQEQRKIPEMYADFCEELGITPLPFYMLTSRAVKRLEPDAKNELLPFLKDATKKNINVVLRRELAGKIANFIHQNGNTHIDGWNPDSLARIDRMVDVGYPFTRFTRSHVMHPWMNVMLGTCWTKRDNGMRPMVWTSKKAREIYLEVERKYPLLFNKADAAAIDKYITDQKGKP